MNQTMTIKEAADIYIVPISRWLPCGATFFVRNEPPGSDDPGGSGLEFNGYALYRGRLRPGLGCR